MYPVDDSDYEDVTVAEVEQEGSGGWGIKRSDGWSFFVPADSQIVPEAGMKARFYGKGIGFAVRGLFLDGVKVFYRTMEEDAEKHRQECEESNRKKREDFEKNRAAEDAKYEALPDVFKRRLDGFRAYNPDFRWDMEPYEMFCVQEALKIAGTLKTAEAVVAYGKAGLEEQRVLVPNIDDGHSGNTHGFSVRLAWLWLSHPNLVPEEHGALCPLVGCEDYGCFVARERREREDADNDAI